MATIKMVFAISDVPPGEAAQILEDLKMAVESLIGQGKSGYANHERAVTGQDLVTLGLATDAQIEGL